MVKKILCTTYANKNSTTLRTHSLTLLLLTSRSFKFPAVFVHGARVMNCSFPSTIAMLDRTIDRHSSVAFVVIRNSEGWQQTGQHWMISTGNKQQGLKTNMADKTRCERLSKPSFRDVFLAWHLPIRHTHETKRLKKPTFYRIQWF